MDVDTADASAAGTEPDQASEPHEGMSTKDLCLTLYIKELETRNKELDVQAMPLHIRALDLLCFCQF